MQNNQALPHLINPKFSAKVALNNLRKSDHELGRPMALCLMFESAQNQIIAASVFELAIALDAALTIPKEKLLAAIRIQWWADALHGSLDQNVGLLIQLQAQFKIRYKFQQQLQGMITKWQASCHDENRNSADGWAEACRIVAIQLGHLKASDQAAKIGKSMNHKIRGKKSIEHSFGFVSAGIRALKQNDRGELCSWLYMIACLNLKLQKNLTDQNPERAYMVFDDPTLVWKILSWHFFGPPR